MITDEPVAAGEVQHGGPSENSQEVAAENRGVVRQREITIQNEQERHLSDQRRSESCDRIILEGIRQVRDGEAVDFDFKSPEDVLSNLKYHAE